MKPDDQYPEAARLAREMFSEKLAQLQQRDMAPAQGSFEFERLYRSIVPPYDDRKFPNKWRKLAQDRPSRTLMAHLGKDSYSHIHYDDTQARTISVREAARLQSFPDGFKFCGAMNAAFRQIGNAVPPLLALAIAKVILRTVRQADATEKASEESLRECLA
jgi:DNA (cytosine-5)-methyltransferase 1